MGRLSESTWVPCPQPCFVLSKLSKFVKGAMELELSFFVCDTAFLSAFAVTADDSFPDVVEELLSVGFLLHDVNRINIQSIHGITIGFSIFFTSLQLIMYELSLIISVKTWQGSYEIGAVFL
jgi:hypothetical protein